MYFRYGTYQHADNSVALMSFLVRPQRTPRGRRMTSRVQMHCAGEVVIDQASLTPLQAQDDLHTKIAAIESAYSVDYQDAGFYRDDGDVTTHFISSSDVNNLTGNCVSYFNWTPGDNEQFATRRSFRFGIHADFLDAYSDIIDYTDTITKTGTGGPIRGWTRLPNGLSVPKQESLYSVQTIVHAGYSVRLSTWGSPPAPLATGVNYLEHLTQIKYTAPKKWGNVGKWAVYKTEWKYFYAFPTNQNIFPILM